MGKGLQIKPSGTMDMTFKDFVEVYAAEIKPRIREHTWITKGVHHRRSEDPEIGQADNHAEVP